MISRRNFMALAPAACATLAGTPGAALARGAAGAAGLRPETFAPHIGTDFTLAGPEGSRRITLTGMTPPQRRPLPNARGVSCLSFTLNFEGKADAAAGEGIHRLTHPELRPMSLFISPCGKTGAGAQKYHAVFNVFDRQA